MTALTKTRQLLARAYFESTLGETIAALGTVERTALRTALEAARVAWPNDPTVIAMLAMLDVASEGAVH